MNTFNSLASTLRRCRAICVVAPALLLAAELAAQPFPAPLFQLQADLGSSSDDFSDFGGSVAINGDTAIIGASEDDTRSGAVYIHVRTATSWSFQARLIAPDRATNDRFGYDVDIEGNTVVIGARTDDSARGSVYVFARNGTNWVFQQKLTASDRAADDFFGESIALSGDSVVVGAPGDDDGASSAGSAYVFVRTNGVWFQQQKIWATDRAANDVFGGDVAMDGNTIVCGALAKDSAGADAGAAYVFFRTNGVWNQQQRLLASDRAASDFFGNSVAVHGDLLVVGAPLNDDDFSSSGSAYVFMRSNSVWTERQKLRASNPHMEQRFGTRVAVSDDAIAVGPGLFGTDFYLFIKTASTWVQGAKRTVPGSSRFLASMDFDGSSIVIGLGDPELTYGPVLVYAPAYDDPSVVAPFARAFLYYADAAFTPGFDTNQAAFRYKQLLYGQDTGGVRARFEMMTNFYGQPERDLATLAENELLKGLSFHPNDASLGNLLLDICYDRTVAETILAKDVLAAAERARFGAPIALPAGANGFTIDNEIPLQRQVLASDRVALQCYFNLLKRELGVQQPAGTNTRWATQVLAFSSQYTTDRWSAAQALGLPNTYTNYGDISTSWASASSDGQREFLELGYSNPTPINTISIYETWHPGAVDKISVRNPNSSLWQEVWSGAATAAGNTSRLFTVTFPLTSFPVNAIRIDINSPAVPNWNEIDAVSISGPGAFVTMTDASFGFRLFESLAPGRGLMAAAIYTNSMLFSGYKDVVLLFDLLRDHGRSAHTLGRLLVGRNSPGDVSEAKTLIGDAQQFLFLQGSLLKNMFPTLPPEEDPSGLAVTIASWSESLNSLGTLRESITGQANLLGFAPDFLMLVENFQGLGSEIFDSFDSFKAQLSLSSPDSPLTHARDRLADARINYTLYKGYEDQLIDQLAKNSESYESRLFEIVGARPTQSRYSDNPTNNPGSELDQQYRSIEVARLRILRNQTEINNLAEEVQIEVHRAGSVSGTIIRYGDKKAAIARTIGHINAAQAGANALAEALSPEKLLTRGVVVGVLNAAVQAGSEEWKGQLDGQKEELAAGEQAEIEGINSAAHVKSLLLGMRTLAVDSMEAALLLQQEVARLAALYREKADLEARIAESNASLARRYFADPVHRLASESSLVTANQHFAEAQNWLFFMVRALEYKWNSPFTNFEYPQDSGRFWSADALFKSRNADELLDFHNAMLSFDTKASQSHDKTYRFDWFSVREDFMGLKQTNDLGRLAMYTDPQTGRMLDAISLFRTNLLRTVRAVQGGQLIVIEFNTVRQIPGQFFFVGPTFDLDGNVIPGFEGRFLDKIDYLQIRLPGNHSLGRPQLAGNLTYGGTGFIRNYNVGHFDPVRPDRLVDELTAYSTRHWFYDFSPGQMRWRFKENLTINAVEMELTPDPRVPPTVTAIEEFKERSVAATGWVLTIPLVQQNVQVMRIDELNDVEIYFHHYSAQRQ